MKYKLKSINGFLLLVIVFIIFEFYSITTLDNNEGPRYDKVPTDNRNKLAEVQNARKQPWYFSTAKKVDWHDYEVG